jgi:hypothetical protein
LLVGLVRHIDVLAILCGCMRVCKIFLPFGDNLDVNVWSVGSPIYGVLAHICDSIAKKL